MPPRMMTLKDLQARNNNNSESYGFNVTDNRGGRKNGCIECLEAFFPNFKLATFNMLFIFICIAMFIITKVVNSAVMGNQDGDQEKWLCTLHFFQAKFTYDIT